MTLKEKLTELQKSMQSIVDGAKGQNRDLTAKEAALIEAKAAEANTLNAQIAAAEKSQAMIRELVELGKGSAGLLDDDTGKRSGFLALAGPSAKAAGHQIGGQMRERAYERGQKSIVAEGSILTPMPLIAKNPIEDGKVPPSIVGVIAAGEQNTPTYRYLRQTDFTNEAAVVAPGQKKPTSTMKVESVDGELHVIAHLSEPVDVFLLNDNDALSGFIVRQLLWGVQAKLQQQILTGTGETETGGVVSKELRGILETTGVQQQAPAADPVTTLRAALTKLEVLGFEGGVFALNPLDWEAIETARATSGSFDLGGPIDRAQRKVWGVQVVLSPDLEPGQAIALDLSCVAIRLGAEGMSIRWDGAGELFEKNQTRALVEGRFGFDVMRPAGCVSIQLGEGGA